MPILRILILLAAAGGCLLTATAADREPATSPYAAWSHGPPTRLDFFPVAVWLQNPSNAARYKAAGINTYVGLWRGPTEQQLAELKAQNMLLLCSQNAAALRHKDDPTIIGWLQSDEPDNAQPRRRGRGYGPPISPSAIVARYEKLRQADPSRPVMLNLGQGVAWDRYIGRGTRTNHPEDYPEYLKGCDLASFDIYPACHRDRRVAGKLWLVPEGVQRLRHWSADRKVIWNCIECTHIDNPAAKATPRQVRAEVWMSLIAGSRGLIYFVHQFKPKFIEAGLLADKEMLAGVTRTNQQIHRLAPILNTPSVANGVEVKTSAADRPVSAMLKQHSGATYVFAVGMRDGKTTATFTVAGIHGTARAEVLDEGRTLTAQDGVFHDTFEPWEVHLYKITAK